MTDDEPKVYPIARGIETTVYSYASQAPNAPSNAPSGSTARLYHDCGGEWTSPGVIEYVDNVAWYRHRCVSCGAYGRAVVAYPKVRTT